jgi:hypothetical protein
MDLLDTLLSQKLFIVSLSLPGVLLLAAIVLSILPRLRKSAQRAKAQKQAKVAARQEGRRKDKERPRRAEEKKENNSSPRVTREGKRATEEVSAAPEEVGEEAQGLESEDETEEETPAPEPVAKAEEMVPSEMQEILSSVFEDEDLMHRYDVLLRGLKDVDIYELLAMSRRVSERLQQGKHVS